MTQLIEKRKNEDMMEESVPQKPAEEEPTSNTPPAPTLSKSWNIDTAHVPIFTGGKVVPCHLQDTNSDIINTASTRLATKNEDEMAIPCLLLPVGGDVAIVDAQRGIKLGSVREGSSLGQKQQSQEEDEEEDDFDADAITTYALSTNHKILLSVTHNQLIRQYSVNITTAATTNKEDEAGPLIDSKETSSPKVSVKLQKTWGKSGHALPVTSMEFHMSNVFVATGSVDGTVRIWDVRGNHVTHIFRPLAGGSGGGSGRLSVTAIRWLDDISHLVIAIGRDDGSIAIHDLRDQDMQHVVILRDHMSAITCLEWWWQGDENDGDLPEEQRNKNHLSSYPSVFVTTGRDAVLNFWSVDSTMAKGHSKKVKHKKKSKHHTTKDSDTKSLIAPVYRRKQTLPLYEEVEGMVIVPDDDSVIVATAGSKGVVRMWKSRISLDGQISEPILFSEQSSSLAYGETRGGYLGMHGIHLPTVTGNSETNQLLVADAEHSLSFLSLHDDQPAGNLNTDRTIVGYNDDVLDLKVIPAFDKNQDPSHIVVATNSAQVRIFDLEHFSCHVLDGHTATVLCVDVSPCGRFIATCGKDKKMNIWHTQSRKCVATAIGHTEAVGATALSRKIGRYEVRGKASRNGGGAFAVTVSVDRTLKRWNLPGCADLEACAAGEGSDELSLDAFVSVRAHEKDINVVSIAPNDSLVATGSQDKSVKLWKATDLSLVATLKGHRRGVWDCQFSPFDRVVATASGDRSIRLWSLSDYSCVRTFQGHVASVLRIRFLNSGLQLMSSGADGLIKLWTIRTNECETTLDDHSDKVWALDVLPNGTKMVSGGADSQLLVWKDTTRETEDAKRAEREETILMDQRLANYLRRKEFMQALDIALKLEKPRLALKVLTFIIETDIREKLSPTKSLKEYIPKWSVERVTQVLGYCRDWNTRARNCDVAMTVIRAIVSILPAENLAKANGVPEILAGVTPYAERHFDRLDRLFASSYLIDFALFSMGSLDNTEVEFANWESKSKPVLPLDFVDGKTQVGGRSVVGRKIKDRKMDDSDDEISVVGDSDSSDDEDDADNAPTATTNTEEAMDDAPNSESGNSSRSDEGDVDSKSSSSDS